LQVFDPFASKIEKLLKEGCNFSPAEYEKPVWERSSIQSTETARNHVNQQVAQKFEMAQCQKLALQDGTVPLIE
jgi:hypothetical protein